VRIVTCKDLLISLDESHITVEFGTQQNWDGMLQMAANTMGTTEWDEGMLNIQAR